MRHGAVALLFLLLAIAMTWPLAYALDRAVAYPGDPYINAWVLDWDWWATFRQPLALFHANIFHPAKYTLAFSEHLYGVAVFLMPFRALGMSPLAAHNLAMIVGFAFSGFGAYLLAWVVTRSPVASIAAGIFYAFLPFRFTHFTHVQHVWAGWLPLMLAALLAFREKSSWRRATGFGVVFLMNGLSNIHAFLFGSFASIATALMLFARKPRDLSRIALVTLLALVLLVPFLYPYHAARQLYGMERSWKEATFYSAEMRDWLNPGFNNRVYRRWGDPNADPERWLFPGVLSLMAAAVAVALGWGERRSMPAALLWIFVGVAGSLGTHTFFYRFLFTHVPGFRAVRATARWAMIAYVGLALLVAIAVAIVERRKRAVAVIIAAALLLELRAAPIRWYSGSPQTPPVYGWLASTALRGAVTELPFTPEFAYRYMLGATAHHKPIVNGITGFVPPDAIRVEAAWYRSPLDDSLIRELARSGTELIIVHADLLGDRGAEVRAWLARELEAGRIAFVRRFDHGIYGDWVFALNKPPAPPSADLRAFLRGEPTRNESAFGAMDGPAPGKLGRHVFFSAWAMSPHGIRGVDLLFNNGQVRFPMYAFEDPALKKAFPWYPATGKPRFMREFEHRPPAVRTDTDVQIEITDGRGVRTLLEGRWIDWP